VNIAGYDEWKTASPYDDDFDAVYCEACGEPLDENVDEPWVEASYCSQACQEGETE
jgi:hypothetical protein